MLQSGESDRRWHWRDMQLEVTYQLPTEEPSERRVGTSWHDRNTGRVYTWSGSEWVSVPVD